MNFEKFNLTEVTDEQVVRFGEGVEIWTNEGEEQSQYVTMYGAERTLVLSVFAYEIDKQYGEWRGRSKYFLMTLN
jgi:hypothetical protein